LQTPSHKVKGFFYDRNSKPKLKHSSYILKDQNERLKFTSHLL